MKAWEIWTYAFPGAGEHPAVIISHPQRVERKQVVEILLCASLRSGASAAPHEVVLNSADGLDWKTLCRCDLIYSVPRDDLRTRRGVVSVERRREIVRKIIWSHGWSGV